MKLKVDTLYGPQVWENALAGNSPTPPDTENKGTEWTFAWDTQELLNGDVHGLPGAGVRARAGAARRLGAVVHAGRRLDEGRKSVLLDAQG